MFYLIIVSIIWALSFGLIKTYLVGLDPNLVSFIRLAISLLVFLPFLRIKTLPKALVGKFVFLGMIQFGIMYIAYIHAYQYLKAYQIALFTIFTPLCVTLINDLLTKKFHPLFLITTSLAVFGTGIIVYKDIGLKDFQWGFVLMQISNMSFAFGQIYYKKLLKDNSLLKDRNVFGLLYLGAVLITALSASLTVSWTMVSISITQMFVLLYLGLIASGLCFFLWNYGAKLTNTGSLAILNNIKIPLAILFAVVFFGESVNLARLLTGGSIIFAALALNEFLKIKISSIDCD
ncbi:MAG: EamA family transporter [bacterium]|nr:EamA family transporter [bacterium]MBU1918248.1 EamA family transporter [bacterium]